MNTKIKITIISLILAATLCTGCGPASDTDVTTVQTLPVGAVVPADPDETDKETKTPDKGSLAGVDYTIVKNGENGRGRLRGYRIDALEQDDSPIYIMIYSGEKSTGGYSIRITDVYEDSDGNFFVKVEETEPDPTSYVTEALTYPSCMLKVNILPKKLKVIDQNENEMEKLNKGIVEEKAGDADVEDDVETDVETDAETLIAVIQDGGGEIMWKTYVYKTSSGYKYRNVETKTKSWGSANWKETDKDSGEVSSKEEIVSIAKKFGSCGFVVFDGEREASSVEDFLSRDI